MEIPRGNSREDIKARRQIIKDFYANWIAEHPEKKVYNKSLKADIHVKCLRNGRPNMEIKTKRGSPKCFSFAGKPAGFWLDCREPPMSMSSITSAVAQ
jgi:hypothetical protein